MLNKVINRTVILNPTNDQLAKKMMCEILGMVDKPAAFLRFFLLNIWTESYSNVDTDGLSLGGFFYLLIMEAREFRPHVYFSSIKLEANPTYMLISGFRENSKNTFISNASNMTMMLFNSSVLRIDCERWVLSRNGASFLRWVNLTFFLDDSPTPSILTYNVSFELDQKTSRNNE